MWILLAIDCQSLGIVHERMLYGPATAYAYGLAVHTRTPIGLLSNGCSATGPFAVKEGKMFMLGIASLLLFVGPSFWNALPSRLRSELLALSLPLFRSRLKTVLFDHGLVMLGRECL